MADLKSIYSRPSTKPRKEGFDPWGRTWTRTLARHCPHCHDVFFDWSAEGQEEQPYQVEPERQLVGSPGRRHPDGYRSTCGDPLCRAAEERSYELRLEGIIYREPSQDNTEGPLPARQGGFRKAGN